MTTTLYRRYRPTKFADIVGQEHITSPLTVALKRKAIAHAYLFHGPRGTGKTTTARVLAQRLNCQKPAKGESCGRCESCQAVTQKRALDILEIDAASHRGIDDIRALQEGLSLVPSTGQYKVYIIDEVHMLTKEAFTALLKTLEEPVAHAVFILATTEFHKVPETIVSRCQVYRFRRAHADDMTQRLHYLLKQEKRDVAPDILNFIIKRSDGCFRDAESLLGQMLMLDQKELTLETVTDTLGLPSYELLDRFLTSLVKAESHGATTAIDEAFALGFDPEQFVSEAIRLARDGAIALITGDKTTNAFTSEPRAAERLPEIIRALVQAQQDLSFVPEPLVAVHLAILTTCTTKGASSPAPQKTQVTQSKPAVQKTAAPQPEAVSAPAAKKPSAPAAQAAAVSVQQLKELWPKLIEHTKGDNAVASTFLRAMEPQAVDGNTITIQAFYALHRNFFDKLNNRELLEKALGELLDMTVSVRTSFDEEASPTTTAVHQETDPEQAEQLLSAVKDVFGEAQA